MFDARIRRLIDPPLDAAARRLVAYGAKADHITIAGALAGVAAAIVIAAGSTWAALALLLSGRLLDGLDGAVARQTRPTDRGAFLDIVLDFAIYAVVPLAFAYRDPIANALPAACVLAAIIVNGAAFLAFAVLAARLDLETTAQGRKSFYYLAGLAEGTETIAVYAAFCIWPGAFAPLAYGFALLCAVSASARIVLASRSLSD